MIAVRSSTLIARAILADGSGAEYRSGDLPPGAGAPGRGPGNAQWLNAQWLVHPEARVGVRKIERFREWIHEELALERARTPVEIWEPLP